MMAIKPRVFKVNLQIADMNRNYYADHLLTIAQHPSETNERLITRILAFVLNAHENLVFAEGITDANQADLWVKDYNDSVQLWIDVGLPDEKQVKKAAQKADKLIVYCYNGRATDIWWNKLKADNYKNFSAYKFEEEVIQHLAELNLAGAKLNFMVQDDEILLTTGNDSLVLKVVALQK